MTASTYLCGRSAAAMLGVFLSLPAAVLWADEVVLMPIDAQAITEDGNEWTVDPDAISLNTSRFPTLSLERRAILEFPLADLPPGAIPLSATLEFSVSTFTTTPVPVIDFHGYAGDGVIEVSDATRAFNMIGQSPPIQSLTTYTADLDSVHLESLLGSASHWGILTYLPIENVQAAMWSVEGFGSPPTLTVEFEVDPCPADLNDDGMVGAADLAQLLGSWGENPGHPADFNGNGIVGPEDLAQLLGNWGACL